MTQTEPYKELFVFDYPDGDDDSPKAYFICNVCGVTVDDAPCTEHAPLNTPGLILVECDATPRHSRTWVLDSEGFTPPCMYCMYDGLQERVDYLERCRHWPWRRSRLFWRLASRAYWLGIVSGYGTSFGGGPYGHRGCAHGFGWRGQRPYILGWQRWKWSCLLRGRHWPGEFVGLGCCSKCLPCPDCGATSGCIDGCENTPASCAQ